MFWCAQEATNPLVGAHLRRGLSARHDYLVHCRETIGKQFSAFRTPLSPSEATMAGLLLNAYYLNIRGALDNMAWALLHALGLMPGVTETGARRTQVYLFGTSFLQRLDIVRPALAARIRSRSAWASGLSSMRDPAAHRIPLIVPGAVLQSDDQVDEFRRREALAARPAHELGGRTRSSFMADAHQVGAFLPMFVIECDGVLSTFPIAKQVARDHVQYLALARQVVQALRQQPVAGQRPSGAASSTTQDPTGDPSGACS